MPSGADSKTLCDGLLLAGGRGTRVGGQDKGLLTVGCSTAAETALALLRPHCDALYVSANRNIDRYANMGRITVLSDLRGGFPGPLGALEAASKQPLAPLLLMLPVDLPLLQPEVLRELRWAMDRAGPDVDLLYASDGEHDQTLCACLRSSCLRHVGQLLDSGEHRLMHWLRTLHTQRLVFQNGAGKSLKNFNDERDWRELLS